MARILVVDDQAVVRRTYQMLLAANGHDVTVAADGEKGLQLLVEDDYDVVMSDTKMSPIDGITFLKKGKELRPDVEWILITGYSSMEEGVEAMKSGAYDYITKQTNTEEILQLIQKAVEKHLLHSRVRVLKERIHGPQAFARIIGNSEPLREVLSMVEKVAPTDTTVLLLGESGTGKELIAEALHELSPRGKKTFVPVNCGAIPPNLEESTLFGHVKGSFTGAASNRDGLFQEANGGTILLDEIGEMQLETQAKLLRVLQEMVVYRVGDTKPTKINVRVIAATNRDLRVMVDEGRFRRDLFYRLNVIAFELPPLRDRGDDILELARYFAEKYSTKMNKAFQGSSDELLTALRSYDWPGNIRELQNVIERLIILSDSPLLEARHLPQEMVMQAKDSATEDAVATASNGEDLTLAATERRHILAVLDLVKGERRLAADKLGITNALLTRKLKEFGEI